VTAAERDQTPGIPIPIRHGMASQPTKGHLTNQPIKGHLTDQPIKGHLTHQPIKGHLTDQPIRTLIEDCMTASRRSPGGCESVSLGRVSLRDRLLHGSQSPARQRLDGVTVEGGGGGGGVGGGGGGAVCSLGRVREGMVITTSRELRGDMISTVITAGQVRYHISDMIMKMTKDCI